MAGAICLNTTPMVSILVAPRLYDESRISCGMVFATSSIDLINIGTMSRVVNEINAVEGLEVEYFQIVDGDSLQDVASWDESGYVGTPR